MIELRVLGGIELKTGNLGGEEIARRPKRLALLLYLVLARPFGFHTRDALLALFWPESNEEKARTSLRQALAVLRDGLGPDALLTRGRAELGIDPQHVQCDAVEYSRLIAASEVERALALYRGDLTPGFNVPAVSPDFQQWLDGERHRLRHAAVRAANTLATGAWSGSNWSGGIAWARRAVSLAPDDESSHRQLIEILAASGDRMGAVAAYETLLKYADERLATRPSPETAALIRSIRARKLEPEAQVIPASQSRPPAELGDSGAPTSIEEAPARLDSSSGTPRASRRPSMAAAGVAILLLTLSVTWWPSWRVSTGRPREVGELDPRRVAVMYFSDNSENQRLRHVASGLTENLIHQLAEAQQLDVISLSGVRPFRDGNASLDSVASVLKVGTVIDGSIQGAGDSVRCTVRLSDVRTKSLVSSQIVTVRAGDVLELEDRVATLAAGVLRRRLGESIELGRIQRGTSSERALDSYLRARQFREDASSVVYGGNDIDRRFALDRLKESDSLALVAMRAAPRWEEPQLLAAWVALERSQLSVPSVRLDAVQSALRAAVELTARYQSSAEAFELLGTAYWRRVLSSPDDTMNQQHATAAERALKRSIELDGTRAGAHGTLSQVLVFKGALAEAEVAATRALALDTFLKNAADIAYNVALGAFTFADYPRAREWCARGRKEFANDFRFLDCRLNLLREDPEAVPDTKLARQLVAEANARDPALSGTEGEHSYNGVFREMIVASIFARRGQRDSARSILARATAAVAGDTEMSIDLHFDEAYVQLLLGDRTRAIELLRLYLTARPNLKAFLGRDPLFRALRTDSSFAAILRES